MAVRLTISKEEEFPKRTREKLLSPPVFIGTAGMAIVSLCLYYSAVLRWQLDLVTITLLTGGLSASLYSLIYGTLVRGWETKKIAHELAGFLAISPTSMYEKEELFIVKLKEFIQSRHPHYVRMLEYSMHSVLPIMEGLLDADCERIDVLVQNPCTTISPLQQQRIIASFNTFKEYLRKRNKIDLLGKEYMIKCHTSPGSLRGRLFDDDKIVISWYTYEYDPKEPKNNRLQIWGHVNPIIEANRGGSEYEYLKKMFLNTFESLWHAGTTVECESAVRQCEARRETA